MADDKEFVAFYREMEKRITSAKADADKKGKPLLVVFGERHDGNPNNLIIESTLFKSVSDHGVRTYDDESDENWLAKSRMKPLEQRKMNSDFIVPFAERGLGMQVHGIEKPDIELNKGLTPAGIVEREDYMIHRLLQNNGDAIMLTGSDHLKAFVESEELQKKFYVVSFLSSQEAIMHPHENSPLGRLVRERDLYNVTSDSDKVRAINLPKRLEKVPLESVFRALLGDKFAAVDKALHPEIPEMPTPAKASEPRNNGRPSAPDPSLVRLMNAPRISEEELAKAERISPQLVNDYRHAGSNADMVISTGKITLGRLALACKNQPAICDLLKRGGSSVALAQGEIDIDKLERMPADRIKTLEKELYSQSGEVTQAYHKITKEENSGTNQLYSTTPPIIKKPTAQQR
jgi:hypothetical protein